MKGGPARGRFAITGSDRSLPVLEAFVDAGWTLCSVFTHPMHGPVERNHDLLRRAQELGAKIVLSRLDEAELHGLQRQACDLLCVVGYPWRIGDWRPHLRWALNFHPSLLPRYRGPCPQVWAILHGHREWGVSAHKLEHDMDAGDVLLQGRFDLDDRECHETLDLKLQMAFRDLARALAPALPAHWHLARAQTEAHYQGAWSAQDRTIDLHSDCATIDRQLRALSPWTCLLSINDTRIHVRRAMVMPAAHGREPGTLIHRDALRLVVACRGGLLAVLEWTLFAPGEVTGSQA